MASKADRAKTAHSRTKHYPKDNAISGEPATHSQALLRTEGQAPCTASPATKASARDIGRQYPEGIPAIGAALISYGEACSAGFRAQWDNLAARAIDPNPFFESWFLLPSIAAIAPQGEESGKNASACPADGHFPEQERGTFPLPALRQLSKTVQLFCLFHQGELQGLIPLIRSSDYYNHLLPHLTNWRHSNIFCGAPLVTPEAASSFWAHLLNFADQHPGHSAFLHIAEIPAEGATTEALRAVLAEQGRDAAIVETAERAALCSELGAEAYFAAALSNKKRKELRRQRNRLAEQGALAFEHLTGEERIGEWAEQFLALEAAGWKGEAGSALASADETAALFRAVMRAGAQQRRLERLALTMDERPIAMLANFISGPAVYSFKTAFDEAYARFSPGVLLQQENLALLDRPEFAWADSCAREGHPMIEKIWREKRSIFSVNIAIGGKLRRKAFHYLARYETGAPPGAI